MKLIKPYKEEKPSLTVNKIRSILTDIGIFVTESCANNGGFYSCRIEISNDELKEYHIGTNGKGVSMEFAYDSAYAEFMERLQNNVLISNTYFFSKYFSKECSFNRYLNINGLKLDFVYDLKRK
ncbi:MAG: hypothetical protein LBE13_22850 [Bacteroidales bacterium]|jgi:ribosomal protein S12 methylthiotransferase accessory factor|nr:hypothetical protein [Bacteroidales bacterium]